MLFRSKNTHYKRHITSPIRVKRHFLARIFNFTFWKKWNCMRVLYLSLPITILNYLDQDSSNNCEEQNRERSLELLWYRRFDVMRTYIITFSNKKIHFRNENRALDENLTCCLNRCSRWLRDYDFFLERSSSKKLFTFQTPFSPFSSNYTP